MYVCVCVGVGAVAGLTVWDVKYVLGVNYLVVLYSQLGLLLGYADESLCKWSGNFHRHNTQWAAHAAISVRRVCHSIRGNVVPIS